VQHNLILSGVGGQGILTIAQAISQAALRRGLQIKQAEVHGMSQRGGGVQSHLRISDQTIYSDLIPAGQADLLIAVEPLESLRYVQYLSPEGVLIASVNAFVNVGNYPAVESVLERIAAQPRHVLIDAERIGRAAGSGRAANIAILGTASLFLEIDPNELEESVAEMFAPKGDRVVEVNRRAFRFGRNAGQAYLDGLQRGATSAAVRHWIDTLSPEHLADPESPDSPVFDPVVVEDQLSGAEEHAVERTLVRVYEEGRRQLFEHEVYSIVQLVGAISPPHHIFLTTEELISKEALAQFPGDEVVIKIVSADIVHKTEAQGIVFVRKDHDAVRTEIDRLIARHREDAEIEGVLVVEFVERTRAGFGNELFVGIRATREFGPVIAAGLGGVDTEYLTAKMKPGVAVAKAPAASTSAEDFLELFKATAAYDILAGRTRGHERIVSDGELLRCFRAFLLLAQRFCVDRGEEGPDVSELEVNPFAFRKHRLIPLDGRGTMAPGTKAIAPRPVHKVDSLLEPKSIAFLGVSAKAKNFGRVILKNVIQCGFSKENLFVIKPGEESIDGVHCVDSISDLPQKVDLLVIAAGANQLPEIVREAITSEKVETGIMIPGGVGETDGSENIVTEVERAISEGRQRPDGGPVFLGPNSLGIISRPGSYDTFFIPGSRLDKRWKAKARPVALISQSGAFIVSRLSNLQTLDPVLAISSGNQLDLTLSDLLVAVVKRDDVQVVGIYAEGFKDLDGQALFGGIREATEAGKRIIFYKAGRTASGRSAAAGHTAAVAGDYEVCQAAAEQAGAIVTDTFKEFEQLLELCTALHEKKVSGRRIGVVSNAGFETVGMADAIIGQRYRVEIAPIGEALQESLSNMLADHRLGGLVNARNPLDITPMAPDAVYEDAVEMMLNSEEIDAVVVGIVPLTPALAAMESELDSEDSVGNRLAKLFERTEKPMVVVVDSGPLYDPLADLLRIKGVPVFRSADQAIRSFGRYLCHRN
jgi:indolepyruvate ferredoxin oxidoreductase beta subunit